MNQEMILFKKILYLSLYVAVYILVFVTKESYTLRKITICLAENPLKQTCEILVQ